MGGTLAPGSLLSGRYRVQGLAGSGGMGAVYKATDTGLGGRIVAVKEMSEDGLSPQEIAETTEAFRQETHLLAGLHHPGLPGIHDHFTAGGRWYLVMDFIEGQTLEQYLRHYGTPGLPVFEVLRLADKICAVLEYLHGHIPPIIFRDLKPSNIMVTASGHVYLIDFGIARLFKPGQAHDTVSLGSAGYAAPEQYGKSQTTVRSDIYSFGATLHELLTGLDPALKPFTFPSIQPWYPQTPPQLEALIMWMVQLDESRRPLDIAAVRHELDKITSQINTTRSAISLQQLPPPVHSVPLYAVPPSPMSTAYPGIPITYRKARMRSLWILAPLGILLTVFCAIAVICSVASSALGQSPAESTAAAQSQGTTDAQGTLSANQSVWSSDENTLSSDENTLSYDVSTLVQDANFSNDLAAYSQDWQQMQQDYSQEQSDYQQRCGPTGNAETVTLDAHTISLDLNSIHYDDTSLTYTIKSLNTDIQQVQSDIATVQADLQTLENDAAGSNGDASVASSESAANAALASAQQQVTASKKALQSAQSQAKQYDQEAATTNTNAQNLANSMHC